MIREILAEMASQRGLHPPPLNGLLRISAGCCAEWRAPRMGQGFCRCSGLSEREENEFILKILEFDYFNFCSQASVTSRL